jgi:predicted RNA methylase
MAREAYFTPGRHVWPLLDLLPLHLMRGFEAWEPAAGQGHIARELKAHFEVLATDIAPPPATLVPVTPLDFLKTSGPSGGQLAIITNPPYGVQNRLAIAFLSHALAIAERRHGVVALLLPFEFDTRLTRRPLIGAHPAFAAKITIAERIRWVNLPQTEAAPMAHHAWFVWSFDAAVRERLLPYRNWVA